VVLLRLRVVGGEEEGLDPDRCGLAAYLAIHHHLGSIDIKDWSARGGRIDIHLGGSDDDGLAAYLSQLARCER
jgi:hypothetical protein